ncbi:hypothetical protein IHE45_06G015300 [Dioscorea alata]|uniref:Uncharacterized protein n=1 Tax=Dioscorea alata TaxID=55571 RepID=A0ACB7VVE9_DIOAL|nr:hypothetical protein IHE45_06G015300 [Dioscorea alata]
MCHIPAISCSPFGKIWLISLLTSFLWQEKLAPQLKKKFPLCFF